MAENTKIEWCDHTFNPWIGCTKVSPACDHCYAERSMPAKMQGVAWGPGAERRRTSASNWALPLRWNKAAFVQCPECGWRGDWKKADVRSGCCPRCNHLPRLFIPARLRVFALSLGDIFDNAVERVLRRDLFALICDTPNLDWLLLTKRIGNAQSMLNQAMHDIYYKNGRWDEFSMLPNVWLGATICNQEEADRDIPKLLAVPAAKRFLSMEPLLGAVNLRGVGTGLGCLIKQSIWTSGTEIERTPRIDWVIVGGESGPKARPMHPDWVRSLRDQCVDAGVPFFFKQWGEWGPNRVTPVHDSYRWPIAAVEPDGGLWSYRIGKKAAGRLLDGREWNEVPT